MFVFFAYIFSFIAIFFAFRLHDKFDPARYYSIFWGGQIIFIYSLFHKSFLFSGIGLAFISIACLIFSAGTFGGRYIGATLAFKTKSYTFKNKLALLFLKLSLVLAFLNVFLGIQAAGFSIMQIVSFKILLEINNTAAVTRYTSGTPVSLMTQLTLIFVYLSSLIGGYLLPLLSGKKKIWSYISLLPPLLITLTQAVKLGFISCIILFGIGMLVSSYSNNQNFIKIRFSNVFKITIYTVLFFTVLLLSMVLRTGKFDIDIILTISKKFVNYAFGHLPAFDQWFAQNIGDIKPSGGIKTFFGISNQLGLADRRQGIFSELTIYGKNNFSGLSTNVYSIYRFLIEDFGLLGTLFMVFIMGIISGYSWLMVRRNSDIFFQIVLIATLFFIFMSFVVSVWAYTSYIMTIFLMYLFLLFSHTKQTRTS